MDVENQIAMDFCKSVWNCVFSMDTQDFEVGTETI